MKFRNLFSFALFFAFSVNAYAKDQPVRVLEIYRSSNANYICYDVNLTPDGNFDLENPIDAYWIMAAKDGHREAMTWVERNRAFGYSVTKSPTDHSLILNIKALPGRPVRLALVDGHLVTEFDISGRAAVLSNVYVKMAHSLIPGVDSIRFKGIDSKNGTKLEETIHP